MDAFAALTPLHEACIRRDYKTPEEVSNILGIVEELIDKGANACQHSNWKIDGNF